MESTYFDPKKVRDLAKKTHWIEPLQREVPFGSVFQTTYLDFPFHDCVTDFPETRGERFDQLCDSMFAGQIAPIVLCAATPDSFPAIIDGRNRIRAHKHNAESTSQPQTALYLLLSPQLIAPRTPEEVGHLLNIARRDLSDGSRAIIAAAKIDIYRREAFRRMKAGRKLAMHEEKGKATQLAGRAAGVSSRTIEAALEILDLGISDLIEAIRAGWLPIFTGYRIRQFPPEQIRQILNPRLKFPEELSEDERFAYKVTRIVNSIRRLTQKGNTGKKETKKKYPQRLRPVFRQSDRLEHGINALEAFCLPPDPDTVSILDRPLIRRLKLTLEKLRAATPKKPCPKHKNKNHDRSCPFCAGKGWLSTSEVERRQKSNAAATNGQPTQTNGEVQACPTTVSESL